MVSEPGYSHDVGPRKKEQKKNYKKELKKIKRIRKEKNRKKRKKKKKRKTKNVKKLLIRKTKDECVYSLIKVKATLIL